MRQSKIMPSRGLLALTLALPALAQSDWQATAGGNIAFDVASVKLSDPAKFRPPTFPLDAGDSFNASGGRFFADFPLSVLITFAYKLTLTPEQRQSMMAGQPKWVSDRYTIEARAEGDPTKDQFRLMMQSLLAERFQLKVHFETRNVPLLALTLIKPGKMGPKLRPHSEGPACDAADDTIFPNRCDVYAMEMQQNRSRILGSRNTTMDLLASALAGPGSLTRPVVDRTGLTGRFDFTIEWTPDPPPGADAQPDPQGPTFIGALHEQLGLKLESTTGDIRVLVIDHADRPSEN